MIIVKYDGTQKEMDRIISEKLEAGFTVTDVSNVGEGDFLGFTEKALVPIITTQPTNSEIAQMISDLQADLTIAGVI